MILSVVCFWEYSNRIKCCNDFVGMTVYPWKLELLNELLKELLNELLKELVEELGLLFLWLKTLELKEQGGE